MAIHTLHMHAVPVRVCTCMQFQLCVAIHGLEINFWPNSGMHQLQASLGRRRRQTSPRLSGRHGRTTRPTKSRRDPCLIGHIWGNIMLILGHFRILFYWCCFFIGQKGGGGWLRFYPPDEPIFGSSFERPSGQIHFQKTPFPPPKKKTVVCL